MDFFTNVFQNQINGNNSQQRRGASPSRAGSRQMPNTFFNSAMDQAQTFMSQAQAMGQAQAQTFMGQTQTQTAGSAVGQTEGAAPRASRKAIRQLPTIVVSSEDLVDENNRECCICFDEHNIGDKVIRLPCAHIYHSKCIAEWLSRHCTCPVCRYELPTDDAAYEEKRKLRMATRKPRFARYELERMAMKDLKTLCVRLKLNNAIFGGIEKKELIQEILDSGKVDIIAAPEPVEYESIMVLRSMGVGKLKKAMSDAGVFFDAKDVVEKEDMVQIFVNSGRIVLLQQMDEEEFDDNNYNLQNMRDEGIEDEGKDDGSNPKRAKTEEEAYNEGKLNNYSQHSLSLETGDVDNLSMIEEKPNFNTGEHACSSAASSTAADAETSFSHNFGRKRTSSYNDYANSTTSLQSEGFTRTSVASLRELAADLHIDISDCIEKKEMADRILAVVGKS